MQEGDDLTTTELLLALRLLLSGVELANSKNVVGANRPNLIGMQGYDRLSMA
jgi:hypothetical protein